MVPSSVGQPECAGVCELTAGPAQSGMFPGVGFCIWPRWLCVLYMPVHLSL